MRPNVHSTIKELLSDKLADLEKFLDADILTYYGNIVDGLENSMLSIIEELAEDKNKKDRLVVILTTSGGSAFAVERFVNIMRHHYNIIDFIVPNFAYSAGTIFCMSGDSIFMDYSSVLGPIDPQVQNKEGNWVAALGYLDKVNQMIERAKSGELTEAEFLWLKDLDLSELRSYEQAKELTIDLLKKWLVSYKFKNWSKHRTNKQLMGQDVTIKQKEERAEEIASKLSDNTKWKSHSRPINIESLKELKLEIVDYSKEYELRGLIRNYYDLLSDFIQSNKIPIFVQTRNYI